MKLWYQTYLIVNNKNFTKNFPLRNVSQNSKYIRYVSVVKECNPRVVIVTKTNEETLGKHFFRFYDTNRNCRNIQVII